MNKMTVLIATGVSIWIGSMLNFFALRALLRKVNMPRGRRQQSVLAAVVTAVLAVPTYIHARQFKALAEGQPVEG